MVSIQFMQVFDNERLFSLKLNLLTVFRVKWHDLARYQKPQRFTSTSVFECTGKKCLSSKHQMEINIRIIQIYLHILLSGIKRWHIKMLKMGIECIKNLNCFRLETTRLVANLSWILEAPDVYSMSMWTQTFFCENLFKKLQWFLEWKHFKNHKFIKAKIWFINSKDNFSNINLCDVKLLPYGCKKSWNFFQRIYCTFFVWHSP